jgi:hypothetical protein
VRKSDSSRQLEKWVSSETVASQRGLERRSRGIPPVGSRYQATAGKDIANREDLSYSIVKSRIRELLTALYLLVVTSYKSLTNPITNPNPMSIH